MSLRQWTISGENGSERLYFMTLLMAKTVNRWWQVNKIWVWSTGDMIMMGENWVLGEKPVPVPLSSSQNPHEVVCGEWICPISLEEKDQWLTGWAMTQPGWHQLLCKYSANNTTKQPVLTHTLCTPSTQWQTHAQKTTLTEIIPCLFLIGSAPLVQFCYEVQYTLVPVRAALALPVQPVGSLEHCATVSHLSPLAPGPVRYWG